MNNKQRTTTNAHPPSAETSINQKGTIMQNKPNLPDAQMNVSEVLTKDYENERHCRGFKNKAKTKPIKPNLSRRSLWRSRIKPYFKRDTYAALRSVAQGRLAQDLRFRKCLP